MPKVKSNNGKMLNKKHMPYASVLIADPEGEKQKRKHDLAMKKSAKLNAQIDKQLEIAEMRGIEAKTTQKIIDQGRELQREEYLETMVATSSANFQQNNSSLDPSSSSLSSTIPEQEESEIDLDILDIDLQNDPDVEDPNTFLDDSTAQLTAEEQRVANMFMNTPDDTFRKLGDFITQKVSVQQASLSIANQNITDDILQEHLRIDPKTIQVYRAIGQFLKRYKSGKLPKPFGLIPLLKNWEDILYLTNPDEWSVHAMYRATRIFSSCMTPPQAQRFYNLVLLPAVRENIKEEGKLRYHLYMALKKAMYKPSAFFNGIVLPLCQEGTSSIREAVIIASIIKKMRVPLLDAAAGLHMMCKMPYSAGSGIFIQSIIEKRYSLPIQAIDTCIAWFVSFKDEKRELPVLWHKTLLSFVQLYRAELTSEQVEELKLLLRAKPHHLITDAIRKVLFGKAKKNQL